MDNGQTETNFGLVGGQQTTTQTTVQQPTATATALPVAAPSIVGVGVVQSVTQAVEAHPAIAPEHNASVAATILATLAQDLPAIFQLSGASPKTQAYTALGLGFVEAVLGAYLAKAQAHA